jgi:dienelactone hydrolase
MITTKRGIEMAVVTRQIEYFIDGESFTGVYAYDDSSNQPRPGVVLVHEWWGPDDHVKSKAQSLAEQGYAALALDMYGTDKRADNPDDAAALMNGTFEDPNTIPTRFDAGLELLKSQQQVDASNIAAMGYCYGGAVVLNMARSGRALKAIGSYHGMLETESPMQAGVFNGEIAVFTGADDPMITSDHVEAFDNEMSQAGVSCSITTYPGVLHGFTNPAATARGEKFGFPLRYDAQADEDSWNTTLEMLSSSFS